MNDSHVKFQLLNGFNDKLLSVDDWNKLAIRTIDYSVFITFQWQKIWWENFGRGKLLLIAAIRNGEVLSIAPLFEDSGMIFFVGSGGSDYLDFIGNINEPGILEGMLNHAMKQVDNFLGFRFYHVPDSSYTINVLSQFAQTYNWTYYDYKTTPSPRLEIDTHPKEAKLSTNKKSLVRSESWFRKNGKLEIHHLSQGEEILLHLPDFFEQHIKRRAITQEPSLFLNPKQKNFYNQLCKEMPETGWLRFSRISWNDQSIAFHLGFNFNGNYLWYKPSFDVSLSKHSPGEVLLRQLILQALEENAQNFDFGLGDEQFKKRFATSSRIVKTIELYPG
jgi:CelD/BcsL family acetyltransferase involved in cellulose biosynthesis